MDQKAEILKQTVIEEEKREVTLADKLREKRKLKKKKNIKRGLIVTFVLLFAYLLYFLFKPYQASADYGICHTLLELMIPYPHTLYVSEVDILRKDRGLRLWYSYTDGFGEYRMEPFICKLAQDPDTGRLKIAELQLNKVTMNPEQVSYLSNALILFEEAPLILNYPIALPDSLGALHFEFDNFRRVRLNTNKYKGP